MQTIDFPNLYLFAPRLLLKNQSTAGGVPSEILTTRVYDVPIGCAGRRMKAHELLNSDEAWCQESPAQDRQGNKLQALDPWAVKWCALGAIQRAYLVSEWGEAMDRLLRALSVSEHGLAQMNNSDKACSLMEWNDDRRSSFLDVRQILLFADI
jgi:hypothetical protein